MSVVETSPPDSTKYVLGTAQLGLDYGIANVGGKPSNEVAARIVQAAWESGARTFDTAQAYGDSEQVLGEVFERLQIGNSVRVMTKLPPEATACDSAELRQAVKHSMTRLGLTCLQGVLLHDAGMLEHYEAKLRPGLKSLVEEDCVEMLGVSVYSVEEFEQSLGFPDMALIQAPCNPADCRIYTGGLLQKALASGKRVFARSLFLQGLLLLEPEEVAERLPAALPLSRAWRGLCAERGESPLRVCHRFAAALPCPVVLGAETAEQARANGEILRLAPLTAEEILGIEGRLAPLVPECVRNPSRWEEA